MNKIIRPTVGRKVWFEHLHTPFCAAPVVSLGWQPMDATIVYVHSDRLVNLRVTDHAGYSHAVQGVTLVQPGDIAPMGPHCTWMPYQVKQANA